MEIWKMKVENKWQQICDEKNLIFLNEEEEIKAFKKFVANYYGYDVKLFQYVTIC